MTPAIRTDEDRSARSSSTSASASRSACSCWSASTSAWPSAVTLGLPSRSPPIQVPKRERPRRRAAASTPSAAELVDERRRARRARRRGAARRGSRRRCAPRRATSGLATRSSSVCHSRSMSSSSRRSTRRCGRLAHGALALVEQVRDLAQLGQDRAPRRLGRVRGEHGPDREAARRRRAARRGRRRRPRSARRPAPASAALGARGLQLARAVDLLGDVGEVEVGRERADEARSPSAASTVGEQDGGRRVAVGAHQAADALDELEHLAPLLAHDGPARAGRRARGCRGAGRPGARPGWRRGPR